MVKFFLAFQAKSFFETYLILRQRVREEESEILKYYAPMIVNGAFSAELALKSMLTENHINYRKEHNLLELFRLLPTELAFEVLSRSVSMTPAYQDHVKWVDELILISEAFVDWRYYFEGGAPVINTGFFNSFVSAVYETFSSRYNVELIENKEQEKTESEIDEMIMENRLHSREVILEKLARKRK